MLDRCDAALSSAVRAIELYASEPSYDDVATRAAACATDRQQARETLSRAVATKESVELLLALARVELSLGDLAAARSDAFRVLDLASENAAALELLRQISSR